MKPSDLLETFRVRLGATQSTVQVTLFQADLMRANLEVMKAALREVQSIAASAGAPRHARDAVIARYNARLAEITQFFPVFFIFESAFRSFTAARLTLAYSDDQWWAPVRDAVVQGRDPLRLQRLGNLAARRDVIDTVVHLVRSMGRNSSGITTCYDLLEGGTLAHVERLIASHWSVIDAALRQSQLPAPITATGFGDLFKIVRNARNDAYHHRMIGNRARAISIAERLLDMLDISLAARIQALDAASIAPLPFAIPVQSRHA
ncbi:MAG: hypothetical protein ABIO86_13150 [Sphingomonas sp.]